MEKLSPNIFVNDMKATIAFYQILGFKVAMSVPETGDDLVWAAMTNGNVEMMFQTYESLGDVLPQISRNSGGSLLFYIDVKNIRDYFEQLQDKVTVLKGLETTFYGATEFSILDNNGYVLTFNEHE